MRKAHVRDGDPEIEPIAVDTFKAEVHAWAEKIGVTPAEVHVKSMTQKWASCSSRGRLTFDSALLSRPVSFRDEVIVHELLHLKVPNHGPVFRALLRTYLGRGSTTSGGTRSVSHTPFAAR